MTGGSSHEMMWYDLPVVVIVRCHEVLHILYLVMIRVLAVWRISTGDSRTHRRIG